MGRSRGGLTTKIHALVDANGLPVVLKLTAGQAHDGRSAPLDMLDRIGKGQILLADRAYNSVMRYPHVHEHIAVHGPTSKPPMPRRKYSGLQCLPLPLPQFRRALLQQAQALPGYRHALRKAC